MSLFSNLSESALTETSYNFKGILIKFRVVSHDLLSTDKRQFLSYFCSNLKMTDEKKHQNVLDKLRCLDEFKKPEHRRKSNAQLGIVAADLLGKVKPFDKSTIMRWRNNEKKFRDQAMGVFDAPGVKKPKNLRSPEATKFGLELSEILIAYGSHSNITNAIMVAEARKLQKEKYPDLKKKGRKGAELINLDFVRDLLGEQGWGYKKVYGHKKPLIPGLIEAANQEIAAALEGYSPGEISNFDESKIVLNYVGDRSKCPPGGFGGRSVNNLDNKKAVTIGQPLRQDGELDFYLLIIDDALSKDIKKKFGKKIYEKMDAKGNKEKLYVHDNGQLYLATRPTHFMNRGIFWQYISRYNKWLKRNGQRRALLVDNLACHYFDKNHKDKWQEENPTSKCYIDDHSFSQLRIKYLPANTTATCQPSDLGLYCTIQAKYKSWFNGLGAQKVNVKRGEKIMKIMKTVSKAVLNKCWSESALSCLHPTEKVTLRPEEEEELESAYAAFEENDTELVDDPDVPSTSGLQSETIPDVNESAGHLGTLISHVNYPY